MIIVQVADHLGQDPETRFTPTGVKVTTLRMATNIRKGGKDVTVWWKITIWGERFDKMMPYFKKGSALFVTGEMSPPQTYTDKNGTVQVSMELTAEMISFNPFGGKASNSGTGTKSGENAGEEGSPGNPSTYSTAGSSYSNKDAYSVAPGAGQANFADTDDIPF
jgi:single-strand DNA-binding protein